jgi:predicted AAA+ superfamily ATPase
MNKIYKITTTNNQNQQKVYLADRNKLEDLAQQFDLSFYPDIDEIVCAHLKDETVYNWNNLSDEELIEFVEHDSRSCKFQIV